MKKNNKNSEKLHQFELTPYPRTLWIAISTDKFEDSLKGVTDFDPSAIAQVDTTYNEKRGGFLIRFINKKSMTIGNIYPKISKATPITICERSRFIAIFYLNKNLFLIFFCF